MLSFFDKTKLPAYGLQEKAMLIVVVGAAPSLVDVEIAVDPDSSSDSISPLLIEMLSNAPDSCRVQLSALTCARKLTPGSSPDIYFLSRAFGFKNFRIQNSFTTLY